MSQQNLFVSWQQQLATWLECQHQWTMPRQRTQDAAPQVVVLDLASDEEQVNKEEANTDVDTDKDEVEQVVAAAAAPPASRPRPYSTGSSTTESDHVVAPAAGQ